MSIDTTGMTRADVAWLLGMSDGWVAMRMRAGDLPRPGLAAPEYVAAYIRYRAARG